MIALVGYNFFGDGNAADPVPTNVVPIKSSELSNGIFHHFYLSTDANTVISTIPTEWVKETLLNAGFQGNLSGGSIEDTAVDVTGYRVKRRKLGEFDWITIAEEQITDLSQLTFTLTDHLASSLTEYEYAFVPLFGTTEGNYIIDSVVSKFDGVFFADQDNIYRLDGNVQYGATSYVQKVGVYEPYGRKKPVVISNGNLSYQTGTVSGVVLNENYEPGQPLDRKAILAQRKLFIDFLNNRRPKILKDWNGAAWLMMVTANPSVEYANGSGMGLGNVLVGWTEVGEVDDKQDLYANGLIPSVD